MAIQSTSGRVFRGSYRLKDGSTRLSGYKLRVRLEIGERYSPKVVDLGLGTKSRVEAQKRARLILQYINKINAYRRPVLRITEASLQVPDYHVG